MTMQKLKLLKEFKQNSEFIELGNEKLAQLNGGSTSATEEVTTDVSRQLETDVLRHRT